MSKLDILTRALRGEFLKRTAVHISDNELSKIKTSTPVVPVIVSLTSYGERVSKTLTAVVASILRQSVRPEKILVWLDDSWNDSNIPQELLKFRCVGVEVRYVKDVRSYKKLVFALAEFPEKTIITVDDDLYYSKDFVKELYEAHLANPGHIICLRYRYPMIDISAESISPYNNWTPKIPDNVSQKDRERFMFPIGYGGILYPPHALYEDATNEDLYMKLAPYADDIWFYIMGLLKGTPKMTIPNPKSTHYFIDLFRQMRTRDRLCDSNLGESRNDTQFKNSFNHYDLFSRLKN